MQLPVWKNTHDNRSSRLINQPSKDQSGHISNNTSLVDPKLAKPLIDILLAPTITLAIKKLEFVCTSTTKYWTWRHEILKRK